MNSKLWTRFHLQRNFRHEFQLQDESSETTWNTRVSFPFYLQINLTFEVLQPCPALVTAVLGGCPGAAPCVCASLAVAGPVTTTSPPAMSLEERNSRRHRAVLYLCLTAEPQLAEAPVMHTENFILAKAFSITHSYTIW